jgi:hypothetical protein
MVKKPLMQWAEELGWIDEAVEQAAAKVVEQAVKKAVDEAREEERQRVREEERQKWLEERQKWLEERQKLLKIIGKYNIPPEEMPTDTDLL